MRKAVLAILAILTSALGAAAVPADPLPVDKAFVLAVSRGPEGSLSLYWEIAEGYYLYRDHISARDSSGKEIVVETASGISKYDPNFGTSEIYYRRADASLPDPGSGAFELAYQGCQEDGICYAPETRLVDPVTLAVSSPSAVDARPTVSWATANTPASTVATASDEKTPEPTGFALAPDDGLVQALLDDGGILLVLASFPMFGLLLAFTPCVFPMYPILAGALAREGDRLTARRGFVLSTIYVVSLASAFALLGAVAGWSGQNLQMVLQSPLTVGILALVFAVLALSMFGLFELRLPTAWTSWIARRTGGIGGPKRSAAVLGFSSALIVGPCVTVPLAGALLYIAQTADVALGAVALFGLGLGKGIPLIVLGTLGVGALPRAGAWMDAVKRVLGFGFLATAIWTATPLLPSSLDLALWAALLIGVASFALTAEWVGATSLATARALGGIALIYGVILMLGAASGATDPLKPLATLVDRGRTDEKPVFDDVASIPDLQTRLDSAGNSKPSIVYFTADWCVTCRIIERAVLPDGAVRQGLAGFQLIKADLSDLDRDNLDLMKQLKVAGPPTILFFDANGREVSGTRLVGEVTVESLTKSAERAKGH